MAGDDSHPALGSSGACACVDVTLAIPMYNSAAFLEDLFASLARLTVMPREILVYDDASGDDSYAEAQRLCHRYRLAGQVRMMRADYNCGVAGAYNRLAREATSSWLHILDADDRLQGDFYRAIQDKLGDSRWGLVVGAARCTQPVVDAVYRLFAALGLRTVPRWLPLLGLLTTRSSVVYRTALVRDRPFPDPGYDGSDIVHYLALRQHAAACFARRAVVYYRIHPGGASRHAATDRYRDALRELAPGPLYWVDFMLRKRLFAFLRK